MKDKWTWLWGRHAVEEALQGGRRVRELWVLHESRGEHIQNMVELARKAGAKIQWVSGKELHRISGGESHQGVALMAVEREGEGLDYFLTKISESDKKSLVLVALDQIQDPHNFGAIARSAVCLGARGILIPERRAAPVTQTVIQASAGAIEKISVINIGNLSQTLIRFKDAGFWVYGADMSGKPAWGTVFNTPMILVIGSEGYGIRPLVKEQCHELVCISQSSQGVSSLNASCAASVLLYEISRQFRSS